MTRFRNFGSLSFLQQVDKPRVLVPLLTPYTAYFRRRGVELAQLRNQDADDRQLLEIFGTVDDDMPGALVEALDVLDDLVDDAGHDHILAAVERNDIPLRGILGEELSPAEFAMAVYCRYPWIVREAHARTPDRGVRIYEEYRALTEQPITLAQATAKLPGLEYLLGHWFEARNRSAVCKIAVREERDELRFEISHGLPFRKTATIKPGQARSHIGYRPQQHDLVIFESRGHILRVSAPSERERDLYRQAFGMAFYEHDNHFTVGEFYNLELLRLSGVVLAPVAGVASARLTELTMQVNDAHENVQHTQGYDLLARGGPCDTSRRARGTILGASFRLAFEAGGPPRKLEIRPPNVALYDRERDGPTTKAFLLANRFLVQAPR